MTLSKEKLQNTKYADDQIMKDALESFEYKTKREFNGGYGFLRVGGRGDRDVKLGIMGGFLKLSRFGYCFGERNYLSFLTGFAARIWNHSLVIRLPN